MSRKLQKHTLTSISFTQLVRLTLAYGISPAYYPRLASLGFSSLLLLPLRLMDRVRSSGVLRRSRFEHPPLFIVGHPRTGTTHLHNLLSRDQRFGCATTFHCAATEYFLGAPAIVRFLMQSVLPESRPMDNVKVGLDEPQEEEMAMARISTLSFNHGLHFPARMREIFDRSVTFETDSRADEQRWKKDYIWFLRRVNVDQQGKPLCLKSPANMARIRQLLDLFPGARFVHIYRDPYVVYASVLALWTKVLPMLTLQKYTHEGVEANLVYFFQRMVQRFYEDRSLIPDGQVTEVRFEDLETNALRELERIYGELRIDGFDAVRPQIEQYVQSLSGYRKNRYTFDAKLIQRVEDAWGFAIDRWNYQRPEE